MMKLTRRNFLRGSLVAGAGLMTSPLESIAAPLYVPAHKLKGNTAPSNIIRIGIIGTGRIARAWDMAGTIKFDDVRIVAVCDLDRNRVEDAKKFVDDFYIEKYGKQDVEVSMYEHYEELLAREDIDAVVICTPDHWHAKVSIDAVRAGKDVYCEKPTALTIEEGRLMSNAVNATGRIFQMGTQQRSMEQFRIAAELVRNGRIGNLKTIEIRLPGDPAGGNPDPMPIPETFNYEKWLGSTPYVPYTVDRVHPQTGYDRPGWLRCEQFGAGMITGWGNHHFDIAQWAMGTEYTGPIEVWGEAKFANSGLWDVHGDYATEMVYANGVKVYGTTNTDEKPNGLLFTGDEGWIFVSRGDYKVSASDPACVSSAPLAASDPKILKEKLRDDEIHLMVSTDHHRNWIDSIRTRMPNISTAEVAHRSCSTCLLQHIAMKLNRRLYWDPIKERFRNDDEANTMLCRPMRSPYVID